MYREGVNEKDGSFKAFKEKRSNPYTGNVPEADAMQRASEGQAFAGGGMVKGKYAEGGPVKGKNPVLAIVAKIAKRPMSGSEEMSKGMEEEEEGAGMMQEAKMAAAEEIMGALKSGDKMAFATGLENFLRCCGEMED